ncbi:choloylglycine hydrolase [Bordetella sp. J329]|jgi:choloylglycine hydrolase|uniref:linear amide C-N hydrolase n=1 Tax=Kerstersia gyiorum TaxID=206506 RepID=UPI000FDCBB07|nr:linear amide C-N hydrolase [Kerstersia gyiorum]AZV95154.1 choloylglycine hydrolase [Bordetella sp. J329]MCH4271601.1 linear amide C-N hydrolase [Kerstersia gyiorum]MCI1228963.1 linear amide C-N hydrolase [Kerstersia gyiorum]
MCTRIVYHGNQGQVFTARSMDWKSDMHTNLWVLPRGIERSGNCGPDSLSWTAKYGSVVATGYDISTTDGVNEAGLSVNLLWLAESQYPSPDPTHPLLTIAAWAQYVLDLFGNVAEAIDALAQQPFSLVTSNIPGEARLTTLHMSLSDSSGDSAIVEYIDGKQVIHHNRDYQVMTNSPTYDEQLALNKYWESIGGTIMLPGTNRAADRFARAQFYINAVEKQDDPDMALASVLSVIRNASVPFGLSTPDQPNISSTRWRTVVDHKRLRYYFESTTTPNVFWVDVSKLDFSPTGAGVHKLELGLNQRNIFHGEVNENFVAAPPFHFLGIPATH